MTSARLTALSVRSLLWWYPAFADPHDSVIFLGEHPTRCAVSAERILTLAAGVEIQIFSGHETLRRDLDLANRLRAAGTAVRGQTSLATGAATDKALAKQMFDHAGLTTPRWGRGIPPTAISVRALVKRRDGTQSQGLAWAAETAGWSDDQYWEEYLDGIEYSVVLHREDGKTVAFPPVWKGATRDDLLPPWQRLRVCPIPDDHSSLTNALVDLAIEAADLLDVWGFAEAEFIVAGGQPYLIEVNPRISGTLRMVAMATGVQIFAPDMLRKAGTRPPTIGFAAELPYAGSPLLTSDVIATSRVTSFGPTAGRSRRLLERYAAATIVAAARWPAGWERGD